MPQYSTHEFNPRSHLVPAIHTQSVGQVPHLSPGSQSRLPQKVEPEVVSRSLPLTLSASVSLELPGSFPGPGSLSASAKELFENDITTDIKIIKSIAYPKNGFFVLLILSDIIN